MQPGLSNNNGWASLDGTTEKLIRTHVIDTQLIKQLHTAHLKYLYNQCIRRVPIVHCLHSRTRFVDCMIQSLITKTCRDGADKLAVFAVGGYGRQELHPYSDIDLLITHTTNASRKVLTGIERLIQTLWDSGLKVSQHVHTLKTCQQHAVKHSSLLSAFTERRPLWDPMHHHRTLSRRLVAAQARWPKKKFLRAKIEEQLLRDALYNKHLHVNEPNIKQSPGCLRDIQMLVWLSRHYMNTTQLTIFKQKNVIHTTSLYTLYSAQWFYWELRALLHFTASRPEDCLSRPYLNQIGHFYSQHTDAADRLLQRLSQQRETVRDINQTIIQQLKSGCL